MERFSLERIFFHFVIISFYDLAQLEYLLASFNPLTEIAFSFQCFVPPPILSRGYIRAIQSGEEISSSLTNRERIQMEGSKLIGKV